jgi:hypothetical protein
MKRFLSIALLAALPLASSAFAQSGTTGANISETFQLKDVLSKRGKIVVGTEVATTIEFDSEIVEHAVGRDDLLLEPVKSKANPGLIYLRAKAPSGSSSLDIMLQSGEMARFTFTINAKLPEGKRYIVKSAPETPAPSETATPSSRPEFPEWLNLEWRTSVSFVLNNQSGNVVIADANRLLVFKLKDGKPARIPYNLRRTSSSGSSFMLAPNATQTGSVALKAADVFDTQEVLVQWTLADNASKTSYLYEKRLSVTPPPITMLRIPVNLPARGPGTPQRGPGTPPNADSITALVLTSSLPVAFDARVNLPTDIGVFFTVRQVEGNQASFEVIVENRSNRALEVTPRDLRLSVMNGTERLLTLALPNASKAQRIAGNAEWTTLLVAPTRLEGVAEYVLSLTITDGANRWMYQRSSSM